MNNINKKLIIITALWCSSCLIMIDTIKKATVNLMNLDIKKLDYDLDEQEIKKYNIENILPVLILIDENGNELRRLIGERSLKDVKSFLKGI